MDVSDPKMPLLESDRSKNNFQSIATSPEAETAIVNSGETDVVPENGSNAKAGAEVVHQKQTAPPEEKNYSVSRARWVSTLTLVLYAMGTYPSSIVGSQYLVHIFSLAANVSEPEGKSTCFVNHSSEQQRLMEEVQAEVSTVSSYYSYAVSVPAVIVSIVMGTYSDVIGRRKILLIPLGATVIKFVINIFIVWFTLSPNYFYLSSIIEGLGGSYFTILLASFSITADINDKKSGRVLWINILIGLNQATMAGFSIASGYVIKLAGFVPAFVMSAGPVAVAFLLGLFLLPETGPKMEGRTLRFVENVGRLVKIYVSEGSRRRRIALALSLLLFFFGVINVLNGSTFDTLFQLGQPLCWDSTQIGYYAALSQGGLAFAGIIFLSVVQWCGCLADEKIAMLGMLFQGSAFVLEAFVKHDWMMYMVPVVAFPAFPAVGIIRGFMSLLAGPYNQGALFASIAVMEAICSIVANTVLFRVYSATVSVMRGAVFLVMASFCFFNIFLFFPFFHFYDGPKTDIKKSVSADLNVSVNSDYSSLSSSGAPSDGRDKNS